MLVIDCRQNSFDLETYLSETLHSRCGGFKRAAIGKIIFKTTSNPEDISLPLTEYATFATIPHDNKGLLGKLESRGEAIQSSSCNPTNGIESNVYCSSELLRWVDPHPISH